MNKRGPRVDDQYHTPKKIRTSEPQSREVLQEGLLELELLSLARTLTPTDEERRSLQAFAYVLKVVIGRAAAAITVCGSLAQLTDLDGAGVDLAVMVPASTDLKRALLAPPLSCFFDVTQIVELKESSLRATSLITVKPRRWSSTLQAHLFLGELGPGRPPPALDSIVRELLDTSAGSRDLVRLVKHWARRHNLSNQYEGFLSGAAWTLLVIFFLQQRGHVSSYTQLQLRSCSGSCIGTLATPLSVLLRQFFSFLAGLGETCRRGISVTDAVTYRCRPGPLFIEDPVEFLQSRQQRNLAQYMGERAWARILFLAAEWAKLTPALAWQQWLELRRSVGAEQLTVVGAAPALVHDPPRPSLLTGAMTTHSRAPEIEHSA